jgi:hypothetical protein
MHLLLAAVLVLNCEPPNEYETRNTRVVREPQLELVRIAAAEARRRTAETKAFDFGAFEAHGLSRVVVHAGEPGEYYDRMWIERTVVVLELRTARGTEWWHLREPEDELLINIRGSALHDRPRLPRVSLVSRALPLLRFEFDREWLSSNSGGTVGHTLLVDLRMRPLRMVLIRCGREFFGGQCGGPNDMFTVKRHLSCQWRGAASDFRCRSREVLHVGWTTRAATREFWLLSDETIAPSRFDAVRYPNGRLFAAAASADRDALKRRVLIDRVGIVEPLFEVSRNRILFGAPSHETGLMIRLFVLELEPARWSEVPMTRLADSRYPVTGVTSEWRPGLAADYTPDHPRLHFDAQELEPVIGKRRLIEVVVTEDDERAIFWVMFDRSDVGAIRVATSAAEHFECGKMIRPPSAFWLGVSDDGLPALVNALPSHHEWVEGSADAPVPYCWTSGTIGWRRGTGFVATLRDAPCIDPYKEAKAVTIGPYGQLSLQSVRSLYP